MQEDGARAGSPNVAIDGSLSAIRQTSSFFKENDENSLVEVSTSAFSEKLSKTFPFSQHPRSLPRSAQQLCSPLGMRDAPKHLSGLPHSE